MKLNKFYDEDTGDFKIGKIVFYVIAVIVFITIIGYAGKLIFFPAEVMTKVINADNAIYNYEWFHQKYETIEAAKRNLKAAKEHHKTWKESVKNKKWTYIENDENARLIANIIGMKQFINNLIADYNAKSSMVTRTLFKGKSLPEKLKYEE